MAGLTVPSIKPNILQPSEEEKQLVQGYRRETDMLTERVAPIKEQMGRLEGEMASAGASPPPPKLQDVPQFQARQVDGSEWLQFAGLATAVAALATKAVRGDVTVALTAAGSAMRGFNEGNLQQAKLDIENFNTKMRGVVAQNNEMLAQYELVLRDRKLTLAQKMQQYQVLAGKYQDELAMTALRKGDLKFELDRLEKVRLGNNQIELKLAQFQTTLVGQLARLEAQQEMMRARLSQAGIGDASGLSPQAVDMLAREAIKDKSVLANLGRGVQGARDLRAITNRMAELMAAEGGPGMAQRRAEFRADSNSLNKMTMSYDAIVAFEQTAVRNGRVLVDLANKVDVTGLPVIERWIRAGRRSIAGDPDVAEFNSQMMVYRTEAAKILTNPNLTGQLTDSARKEVEEFLHANDSAEQITRVVNLLERDFGRRKHTLENQMDAVRDRMTRGYGAGTQPGREAPGAPRTFASEAEAAAAGLQDGARVIINGVPGTWKN